MTSQIGPEPHDLIARVTELEGLVASLSAMLRPGTEQPPEASPEAESGGLAPDEDALVWPPKTIGQVTGFGWGDAAGPDEWAALVDWADWFLHTYDLKDQRVLRVCWPDHPGVVEELAALWMAWCDAVEQSREGAGEALAYWHDRYLPGFLARMSGYQINTCVAPEHRPPKVTGESRTSRRDLISVRATAVSQPGDDHSAGPQPVQQRPVGNTDDAGVEQ